MAPLSQRLGKPSRSYLAGLNEAGDGAETGSVLSYRSGGSNFSQQPRRSGQNGSVAGSQTGSTRGSIFGSGGVSGIMRGRQTAASDVGGGNRYSQTMPTGRDSASRRSVTFSDMSPAMFDERDRLEVMSDIGGYGRGKKRTPSIASSVMSNDNASDAGSTMSTRRSVRRGSRSDRVVQPPQSLNLWHNDLGGAGTSGSIKSSSNPLSSIVKRKSTLGSAPPITGNSQPSRRYSTGPAPISSSASASGYLPSQTPAAQRSIDSLVLPSAQGIRTGTDASGRSYEIPPVPPIPEDPSRPNTLQRSSSAGSTGSRKSSRGGAGQAPAGSLHSATLRNNLMNAPPPPVSPGKRKTRSPEQTAEALARSGKLDRLMHVVPEAEEEPEPERPSRTYTMNRGPEVSVTGPTPSHTLQDLHSAAGNSELPYISQETPSVQAGSTNPTQQVASSRVPEAGPLDVTQIMQSLAASAPAAQRSAEQTVVKPPVQAAEPSQANQITAARLAIQAAEQSEHYSAQPGTVVQPLYEQAEKPALHTRDSSVSTVGTIGRSATPGFDNFVTPPSTPPQSPTLEKAILPGQSLHQPQSTEARDVTPTQSDPNGHIAAPAHSEISSESAAAQSPQRSFDMLVPAGTMPMPSHSGTPLRLESLSLSSTIFPTHTSRSLSGTVLVLSSFSQAVVFVRLTANGWSTYEEVEATAPSVEASADGQEFGRYSFSWHIPPGTAEADVQLALRLEDKATNQAHWDNNGGRNYSAKIPAPVTPNGGLSRAPSIKVPEREQATTVNDSIPQQPQQQPVSGPPQVMLTRTLSDASHGPNMLYNPKRVSLASTHENAVNGQDIPVAAVEQQSQTVETAPYVPVSQLPFPGPVYAAHRQSPSDNASTLSSSTSTADNGDAPTSPATSVSTMQQGMPSSIPKHILHERAATEPSTNNSYAQPVSRAHSTASRTSFDSSNQTFSYPSSRNDSYAASVASSQQNRPMHMYPRGRASTEIHQQDLPSIMSALDQYPSTVANGQNGHQIKPNMHSRSGSVRSDTGSVSQAGMSSRTVSTARRGNTEAPAVPQPLSGSAVAAGIAAGRSNGSTMRALTLTSNAAQTLNRGFFKNNQQKTLRQNPMSGQIGSSATIAFGTLAPLPMKIRSDECLVQVFAAGLDFWDRAKVEILAARGQGYGFIPGRAFVGKVIETGLDVDTTKVKKGEFVYGLNDLKKSGALGDYITVQRTLLTRAPNGALSLEQIAAVALSGIAAFQAMDELCSTLARGSKLVILNAHEGVGAIALQLGQSLRTAHDLWIVAHYPPDFSDGDSILRALGASETLCGEVVSAVQSLRESSYDAVLDTIGGRRIYDVSKVILHDDAYFVTTVGDALSVPTAKAHWKVSLKSIFKRSEKKKNIAYWFPSLDQDARAALDRLREISEAGHLKPVVKRVYKFEDGANAFKGGNEQAIVMILDQEKLMNGINSSSQ